MDPRSESRTSAREGGDGAPSTPTVAGTAGARSGALVLAREFVRAPWATASVAPSSAAVCRSIAAPVPETGDPVVLELGAGTGVVTAEVQRRLGSRGRHLAVELNPVLVGALRSRFPAVEVVGTDARAVPDLLAARGLLPDVVLSTLPWAAFDRWGRGGLLHRLAAHLAPDAALVQLGYAVTRWAPPARAQRADLRALFEEVTTSRTVWRNLPPAVVHVARRPRVTPR